MEGNQNTNRPARGQRRASSSLRQRIQSRRTLNISGGVLLICASLFFALNNQSTQMEAEIQLKSEVESITENAAALVEAENTAADDASEAAANTSTDIALTEAETVVAATASSQETASTGSFSGQSTQGSREVLSPQRTAEIQWSQFAAEVEGMATVLNWTTQSELHAHTFAVERSLDNQTFENIGQLAAKGRNGRGARYAFTDEALGELHMPLVYYRIRHVDASGNAILSEVIEKDLNFQLGAYVKVFPSAVPEEMTIRYAADAATTFDLQILNGVGEVMLEKAGLPAELSPRQLRLEVAGWEKGTYYIQLLGPEHSVTEMFELP